MLKIDFEADVPIYIQLRNGIIEEIAKGELTAGDSLPSVRQLAEDIGINMHTVNKAYNILKEEGFISIDRRKGAVIRDNSGTINEEYLDKLKEAITPIAAEVNCRGMNEEEFLKVCRNIFNLFEGGSNK